MVVFKNMPWLPEIPIFTAEKKTQLGILSFEAAKTMSSLLSLYKSVSDEEISKLKSAVKSDGVAYLNSKNECFLLSLAFSEKLEELDKAAMVVARLGHKCTDIGLNQFDSVYTDLKLGISDFNKLRYGSKKSEKRVAKMERLICATSSLYSALEALAETEVNEKKWRKKNPLQNLDGFDEKLEQQKNRVHHFRGVSLWSKSFDKTVNLMAHLVCIVYTRICSVFGSYIQLLDLKNRILTRSGPIHSTSEPTLVRFYSTKQVVNGFDTENSTEKNRVFHMAGQSTVGGCGLAMRYANVIQLAEKYLNPSENLDQDEREYLYQMLPENVRGAVRVKLSKKMKSAEEDEQLAAGWREAMAEILRWLSPVANDTVMWQRERNFERVKFDSKASSVLLLQTLHFSDKEKTEAAIVELLVGLSCIYRFENRGV